MKSDLCIYHGNCADGFTAAWVVRNALGEENVDFVPGFYHIPLHITMNQFFGNNNEAGAEWYDVIDGYDTVYLVDFSYKRPVLSELAQICKRIVIIDHHKTAQQDLVDLPANVECHFDMDHSGAMLTWMYFVKQGAISVYIPGANTDVLQCNQCQMTFTSMHRYSFSM